MSVTVNSSKQSTQASSASASRDGSDGIVARDLAGLQLLPVGVDALVHIRHEGVEMHRRLRRTVSASKNRSISMVLPRPTEPQT